MLHGRKIAVVMPAYNAEKTLRDTYNDIPKDIVDDIILVDDCSSDCTAKLARELGLHTIVHQKNRGYGGNQKTCYRAALERGADVVIMVHPDYQYDPTLILAMSSMIIDGPYDAVIASRILGGTARSGGMPLYKYISNRLLTAIQNFLQGAKLSEYHTGYRAYARPLLEAIPFENNSEDFVFDNQILAQIIMGGFALGELSCPTKYFPEASSIKLRRSIQYGFGVLSTSVLFRLHRMGLVRARLFAWAAPDSAKTV